MLQRLENLKKRIHAFRLPIRNKYLLFAVKTIYFLTPIVGGHYLMTNYVMPDPRARESELLKHAPPETIQAIAAKRTDIKHSIDKGDLQALARERAELDDMLARALQAERAVSSAPLPN